MAVLYAPVAVALLLPAQAQPPSAVVLDPSAFEYSPTAVGENAPMALLWRPMAVEPVFQAVADYPTAVPPSKRALLSPPIAVVLAAFACELLP